ncbi:MAG: IS200/IS605 family transposase [Chitinophagales bacterium]
MANTYTQLYVHFVFAVKARQHLIPKTHKDQVYKYMTGAIQNRKHKLIAINGMPDHVHVFVGLHPNQSISDLAEETKTAATKFIKKQPWMKFDFAWQKGFGAFSYSRSQLDVVVKYIQNQEVHHQTTTFREEYLAFLEKFEVDYDERYVFEFFD